MTNQPLSVRNVTIQTATIRVQTLTLSARQVTLSVFRQLREESILNDLRKPAFLRGVGWGWVNYCPGRGRCYYLDNSIPVAHHHLVWQLDDELRHCPLAYPTISGAYGDLDFVIALDDLPQLFIAV